MGGNRAAVARVESFPYLYDRFQARIERDIRLFPRVLIVGGIGMGKSTLAGRLQESSIVRDVGALVVDDLDLGSRQDIEEWASGRRKDSKMIALTSRPISISSKGMASARLMQSFDLSIPLDPWLSKPETLHLLEQHWKSYLENAEGSPRFPGKDASDWTESIVEVSGGHPRLLGVLSRLYLRLLTTDFELLSSKERCLLDLAGSGSATQIEGYLESSLADIVPALINSAAFSIRDENSAVFDWLLAHYESTPEGSFVLSSEPGHNHRRRLLESGLLRPEGSERNAGSESLVPAGGAFFDRELQRILSELAGNREAHPYETVSNRGSTGSRRGSGGSSREDARSASVDTKVGPYDRQPPTRFVRGRWRIEEEKPGEGLVLIFDAHDLAAGPLLAPPRLSGSAWRLLQILADRAGEAASISDLRGELGVGSDAAVRSTIQRLVYELRKAGVQNLVENVRGQGYRLPEVPWLEIETN